MKKELIFHYNIVKLCMRFVFALLSLLLIFYGLLSLQKWTFMWIVVDVLVLACILLYAIVKFKNIRSKDYFIKCDEKGVYTQEAFAFCPWSNIKNIELKRYMGYQTLFFEVKEDNIASKIGVIRKNGKIYYCLPMADCKGKRKDIYTQILKYYIKAK